MVQASSGGSSGGAKGFSTGLQVAGTIFELLGIKTQADAMESASRFNAAQLERQADDVMRQWADDDRRFRMAIRAQEGSNRVAVASSGVTMSGSAAEVMRANAIQAGEDSTQLRMNALRQEFELRSQAREVRRQARYQKRASGLLMGATLVRGVANIAGG